MKDKKFAKQLEAFGVEALQLVEQDHVAKRKQINFEVTLGITEGRQWVYNKLDFCCVHSTPFVAGKPDATAFLCGLQEFGHQLESEVLQASPNEYALMLQEAAARNSPRQQKDED